MDMLEYDKNLFSRTLEGYTVVLALCGSISIYRIPDLVRNLRREGAEVITTMSFNAAQFISPEVMKWASENSVITRISGELEHINIFSENGDKKIFLVAPASYNCIGKISSGIADTVPSLFFSQALGSNVKTLIAPAMHRSMMENPVNKKNIDKLISMGISIVNPVYSGDKAKLGDNNCIIDHVSRCVHNELSGRRILIISGRGEARIDPVRSLTNDGTGFTGYWIARNAFRLGADKITYIGNSEESMPDYVNYIPAKTFDEFKSNTIKELKNNYDIVIVSAALPDFEVINKNEEKYDSNKEITIKLKPVKKLLNIIRENFSGLLVAFRLTSDFNEDVMAHFKNVPDLVVVNTYKMEPFGRITNHYIFAGNNISEDMGVMPKPVMTKKLLIYLSGLKGRGV